MTRTNNNACWYDSEAEVGIWTDVFIATRDKEMVDTVAQLYFSTDHQLPLLTNFHDTFNNISFISWRSVLLVEETGEPTENHRSVASN